jgi:hypothetical protein
VTVLGCCTNTCTNGCLTIYNPNNIVVNSCTNVPVYYYPTVTDACCSNWSVMCSPTNGSVFVTGTTTTVLVTATDSCGDSNTCSFPVTVLCTNSIYLVNPLSITSTGGGFIVLNWSNQPYMTTNAPYKLLTNWQLEYSTDLFYWKTTNTSVAPPVILNLSNGPPREFFRLQLQGP